MDISTGLLGQVNPISALRCGFSSLEPISIKKTRKKLGLKFKTVEWKFIRKNERNDLIDRYPSYIQFQNELVLEKIKLPPDFDAGSFSKMLTKNALERFKKDRELQSELSKLRKKKETAKPLCDFIVFMLKRHEKSKPENLLIMTELFAQSNLPFSFFADSVMLNEIFGGFMEAIQRKVNLYESVWLRRYADNRVLFHKKFQEMKRSLIPLFDVIEQSSFLQKCLNILVMAPNCSKTNSSFSIDFLDFKKVDFKQFSPLSNEFRVSLDNCVSTILTYEPNAFSSIPETDMNKIFAQILVGD